MSTRAIRKLRGDAALIPQVVVSGEDSAEEEESSGDEYLASRNNPTAGRFLLGDDEDDDEDNESSSSSEEEEESLRRGSQLESSGKEVAEAKESPLPVSEGKDSAPRTAEVEEDLDAILNEFQAKDEQKECLDEKSNENFPRCFSIILEAMDTRDLDYDSSMRSALLGGGLTSGNNASSGRSRKNRQSLLFGSPRDGWIRPPHYVGGGIGMTTYDRDPRNVPWPYCDPNTMESDEDRQPSWMDPKVWFSFIYSDSYARDLADYSTIQMSGDINALVMFVAHHPFITEALLQLTLVLYQTNHSQEGLALLRRCLWILESSALLSFTRDLDSMAFLDFDQKENVVFFRALFTLAQVSNIAGLPRTSLAACRFLLSLDPLRDPVGVLLMLDHVALASFMKKLDRWLINLVESGQVRIWYRDQQDHRKVYSCGLLDLPNFAYSYALALYRATYYQHEQVVQTKEKADQAIQKAISRFPIIVSLLLQENDVDTTGRSFHRDWVTVLDFVNRHGKKMQYSWTASNDVDTIELVATLQASDLISRIFVKQNAKLWGDDGVLQWVYDNLVEFKSQDPDIPPPPSPALMRYSASNPAEYENRIQQLPQDANIVDPNLVAHAMAVDPNRRRFLRRHPRDAGVGIDDADDENAAGWMPIPNRVIAGPPTQVVDPDWPLLEVFWRSFLPWNHVEGVPPPRR